MLDLLISLIFVPLASYSAGHVCNWNDDDNVVQFPPILSEKVAEAENEPKKRPQFELRERVEQYTVVGRTREARVPSDSDQWVIARDTSAENLVELTIPQDSGWLELAVGISSCTR